MQGVAALDARVLACGVIIAAGGHLRIAHKWSIERSIGVCRSACVSLGVGDGLRDPGTMGAISTCAWAVGVLMQVHGATYGVNGVTKDSVDEAGRLCTCVLW